MKTLETGNEKIQKICDVLRKDTLEPAKIEAESIISQANERAEEIIIEAQRRADEMIKESQSIIEQQNNVFQSSLEQASKQSLEALRQSIEHKLFRQELSDLITSHTSDPKVIANLINALIKAIEKEGLAVDLNVFIPANASEKEINHLLGERVLKKLKEKSVGLGDFTGGAQVRLDKKRLTIDITDADLAELLSKYIRKDLRKWIFTDV